MDDVYRSRPSEFVRTRDAVAARLRKAGRTDEAAQIERLRKPSPALWAVNQLAHEALDDVVDLVKAVERLQGAQIGARHTLGEAKDQQRQALEGLLKRAGAILTNAGLSSSPAVLGRVSATLLGAAVDAHGRADLRRGRLTQERPAPGFEAFALKRVPRDHRAKADLRAPAEALDARRAAQREARATARRAIQLERLAAQRLRVSDETAHTVERLREQLRQAEARLAEERRAAEEAARFATRARQDAQRTAAQASP